MKTCLKCGETINEKKDRYVSLLTHDGKKLIEDKYFHINCWRVYFQERISKNIKEMAKKATGMMRGMVNEIQA